MNPGGRYSGFAWSRRRCRTPIEKRDSVFQRSMPSDLIRGWTPVRVKKTRQNRNPEPGSDSIRTGKALRVRLLGSGLRRDALPQLPGRDESDADQFAPAPDQRAYPPHLAARGQRKAEHFWHREVAHVEAGAVLGNIEDVALDPWRIRRRNQESPLAQVDPYELAGTQIFAVSRHDFSCAGKY